MMLDHHLARMDLTDDQLLANLRAALAVDDEPTACGWLTRLAGRQPRNAGVGLLAVVAALRGEGAGA